MADRKWKQLDGSTQAKHQTPDGGIIISEVDTIRGVLVQFLRELDAPFPNPQYDHKFAQAACDEALRLGFSPTHFLSPEFQQAFQPGAAMCMTLYPHLSVSSRYYICIYTACVAYVDDLALRDATVVREFNVSFLQNKKHAHPILDGLAIILRTTHDHFSENNASMIITSTLDFISSLVMEHDQQEMMVHTASKHYPEYLRYLTGIARAYALFFFPRTSPPNLYSNHSGHDSLHQLCEVRRAFSRHASDSPQHSSDIFSFYKEELEGETSNQMCLVARVRGCTKLEAMEYLAQVSVDSVRRIEVVLESHPEALALAKKYFAPGYIGFHALSRESGGIAEIDRNSIRDTLVRFLGELNTPFPNPQYDHQFAQAACNEAMRLGLSSTHFYLSEFQQAFRPAAAICMTLYPHLSTSTRYYICIFAACTIYLDDLAPKDATVVKEFNMSFLQNKKHMHPILDCLAILLRTTQNHFNENDASMIITNTLDYVPSLIMERDQQSMVVHAAAKNYPGYLWSSPGIARPFALFFFPPNIPFQTYVQIIPDMINYINDVNDIFSLYKEELAGETSNHICLIAQVQGCTKLEAMVHSAQVSIDGARRMAAVLEFHPEACALVRKYLVQGFIGFHALSCERYRLDDLLLGDDKF
ncbi:isoprenoid synthase domain-containing protein [Infundibulicybe gibba]|nr:isoprenoid synthase domain-containing protein [Infundibulicybe gibba]